MRYKKKERGFSIFEFIVVTMIISLAFTINPLNLSILSKLKLKSEALKLFYSLENANRISKTYNIKLIFKVNENSNSYKILDPRTNKLLFSDKLYKNIKITSVKPSNKITFYPNGVCSPSSILISNGSKKCHIFQSLKGGKRVECEK